MSIAPFLPGLPVPVAPDGGTAPDASAGDPGSAGSAFGDALAAALAGSLAVAPPPATTPAVTSTTPAATSTTPDAPAPQPTPGVPLAPVQLGVPSADLGVPSADLGVPSADLGVPSADLGVPSLELGVRPAESGVPDPAPRRTTEGTPAGVLGSALGPADAAEVSVVGVPVPTLETSNSADQSPDSTVETANSTSGTPNSAVTTPNSAGAAVTKAVVQQVFPEVTRVVSTVVAPAPGAAGPANGTHRITLTLQPEQLGEVRVTLVVRDGAVHVRLSGAEGVEGAAVHRALASEAPELQRILERTGADARVTVRDPFAPLLPPAPATPSAPGGLQTGADGQARSEAQARQDGQDGRDRQAAHEQPRDQARRQEPPRASYPIEPTPVAGRLDRTV